MTTAAKSLGALPMPGKRAPANAAELTPGSLGLDGLDVDPARIRQFAAEFALVDARGEGRVPRARMAEAIGFGDEASPFVDVIMRWFDTRGTGYVQLRDYVRTMLVLTSGEERHQLDLAFAAYDIDGNGQISHAEIERLVGAVRAPLGRARVAAPAVEGRGRARTPMARRSGTGGSGRAAAAAAAGGAGAQRPGSAGRLRPPGAKGGAAGAAAELDTLLAKQRARRAAAERAAIAADAARLCAALDPEGRGYATRADFERLFFGERRALLAATAGAHEAEAEAAAAAAAAGAPAAGSPPSGGAPWRAGGGRAPAGWRGLRGVMRVRASAAQASRTSSPPRLGDGGGGGGAAAAHRHGAPPRAGPLGGGGASPRRRWSTPGSPPGGPGSPAPGRRGAADSAAHGAPGAARGRRGAAAAPNAKGRLVTFGHRKWQHALHMMLGIREAVERAADADAIVTKQRAARLSGTPSPQRLRTTTDSAERDGGGGAQPAAAAAGSRAAPPPMHSALSATLDELPPLTDADCASKVSFWLHGGAGAEDDGSDALLRSDDEQPAAGSMAAATLSSRAPPGASLHAHAHGSELVTPNSTAGTTTGSTHSLASTAVWGSHPLIEYTQRDSSVAALGEEAMAAMLAGAHGQSQAALLHAAQSSALLSAEEAAQLRAAAAAEAASRRGSVDEGGPAGAPPGAAAGPRRGSLALAAPAERGGAAAGDQSSTAMARDAAERRRSHMHAQAAERRRSASAPRAAPPHGRTPAPRRAPAPPRRAARPYGFKNYAPRAFRHVRLLCGISDAEYVRSLGPEQVFGSLLLGSFASVSELQSEGKSGAFFYFSADSNYLLKTISRAEMRYLREILPRYVAHLRRRDKLARRAAAAGAGGGGAGAVPTGASLLPRITSAHELRLPDGTRVPFVVMRNVFATDRRIHERFDLKGSTVGRLTDAETLARTPDATQKDLNLGARTFALPAPKRAALLEAISADLEFLQSVRSMDYSLLIGVHRRGGQRAHSAAAAAAAAAPASASAAALDSALDHAEAEASTAAADARATPTRTPAALRAPSDVDLRFAEARWQTRMLTLGGGSGYLGAPSAGAPGIGSVAESPEPPTPPARASGSGARAPPALAGALADTPDGGIYAAPPRSDAEGGRGGAQEAEPTEVLYIGLIDITTTWGVSKQAERAVKGIVHSRHAISAVPPAEYAQRMLAFLQAKIVADGPSQDAEARV